jgi:asparagine synthase (glutamine-hydrolysing)
MCGICGVFGYRDGAPASEHEVRAMADAIAHRGPDGEGYFVDGAVGLGHRRLSIIDLSAAGAQPMHSASGRYVIVFNGEIYNYLELRQQLAASGVRFQSHSDTEVLLQLFERDGPDCVHKLNGMFAFAVWDRHARTLFAARDRFGVKPFYWYERNGRIAFASEIKALFRLGELAPEMDGRGLADYLTFQFCLEDKTLFRHVHRLLPGHTLTVRAGEAPVVRKYWDLDFTVDAVHPSEYYEHQLLRLLEDSVRLQLRADVPLGAHLSGGLDSSTVACLATSLLGAPIHTFTGGFSDGAQYDETGYARIVAEQTASHHHEIFPTARDFVDSMPRLAWQMDEPAAGPGLFPQYFVSRLASQHVKVVLGGQGADEIFGGYTRYLVAYLEECIRGGIEGTQEDSKYVVSFESILPNLPQLQSYRPLLRHFWRDGLFDAPAKRYFRLIDRSDEVRPLISPAALDAADGYKAFDAYEAVFNEGDCKSYINRMTHFDLKTLLPALLQVEDRTSMAVSLESRVPILDHRIAELVASMPPKIKYEGGRSKHIFRKVVQHVTPQAILERKDKMGFPVPLSEWYREGPVRDFVHDTLMGQRARERGIFDTAKVAELLDHERAYGRGIWGLLSLELWLQAYMDGSHGLSA